MKSSLCSVTKNDTDSFNPTGHSSDREKCFQLYEWCINAFPANIEIIKCHMFSVNCNMSRAVYFFVPWEESGCIKAPKQRLVKYVNIKIGQRSLVHIIFKVSSIDICICNYSTLFSVVIEWVKMLTGTIMTDCMTAYTVHIGAFMYTHTYTYVILGLPNFLLPFF